MVLARKPIAALPGAVLDRTVAKDGVVHAGLVALQICEAGEGSAAVVTAEGLCWSSWLVSDVPGWGVGVWMELTWIERVNLNLDLSLLVRVGRKLTWGLPRRGWCSCCRRCC